MHAQLILRLSYRYLTCKNDECQNKSLTKLIKSEKFILSAISPSQESQIVHHCLRQISHLPKLTFKEKFEKVFGLHSRRHSGSEPRIQYEINEQWLTSLESFHYRLVDT